MADVADEWMRDAKEEAEAASARVAPPNRQVVAFPERRAAIAPGMPPAAPIPTPYVWVDPATLPRRPWLYGTHLARQMVSATIAPGATGKTSLLIADALALASGRPIMGLSVPERQTVWLLCLEETRAELRLRVAAAMVHHGIEPSEIEGRLYIDGNDTVVHIARQNRDGTQVDAPLVEGIKKHCASLGIDVLVLDPFVKSHNVQENDNGAIDTVVTQWAHIARDCNIAVELVHHSRKGNGNALSTEDSRGASALVFATRDSRVLNKSGLETRKSMGIPDSDQSTYFSVTQDKPNNSPGTRAKWYRTIGVHLANGEWVAAVEPWAQPDAFEGVSSADTLRVQQAIASMEDARADERATDWVGYLIADLLGISLPERKTAERTRVKKLIATWLTNGVLVRGEGKRQSNGKYPPIVKVGEWITTSPEE